MSTNRSTSNLFSSGKAVAPESRILFIDVDGTLIGHSQVLEATTAPAIRAVQDLGHLVYLATGRALQNVPEAVLQIGFDGAITNGGGSVISGDQLLFERTLSQEESTRLFDHFHKENIGHLVQTTGTSYVSPDFIQSVKELEDHLASTGAKEQDMAVLRWVRSFPPISDIDDTTMMKAVFNSLDPDVVEKTRDALGDIFHVVDGSIQTSVGTTGELGPLGITKGSAIHQVLDHLGIDPGMSIGIGDSFNDVEMFDEVGVSVAMGNAEPELKVRADLVTTAVNDNGIRNALRLLDLF